MKKIFLLIISFLAFSNYAYSFPTPEKCPTAATIINEGVQIEKSGDIWFAFNKKSRFDTNDVWSFGVFIDGSNMDEEEVQERVNKILAGLYFVKGPVAGSNVATCYYKSTRLSKYVLMDAMAITPAVNSKVGIR